jgi:hypothetical protein
VTVLFTPFFAPTLHDLAIMLATLRESFPRILLADTLIFSRKSRVHRAQIRTNNGTTWVQLPIHPEDKKAKLNEARIDSEKNWVKLLIQTLETAYGGSPYYEEYMPWFEDILHQAPGAPFLQITQQFRHRIFEFLHLPELKTAEVYWSSLNSTEQKEANPLLQEPESKNYMPQIAKNPIFPFQHPEYSQHFGGFIPGLCLLDLLFEVGPESWKVIDELSTQLNI